MRKDLRLTSLAVLAVMAALAGCGQQRAPRTDVLVELQSTATHADVLAVQHACGQLPMVQAREIYHYSARHIRRLKQMNKKIPSLAMPSRWALSLTLREDFDSTPGQRLMTCLHGQPSVLNTTVAL